MKINNLETFKNTLKERMAFGACIALRDASISEIAADSGFDFCWLDMEHGVMTDTDLMYHIMALRGTSCAPFVRVAENSHTLIKKVIDLAPAGIIVPMVNTAEDARKVVEACRFPMDGGSRGFGPRRGWRYGDIPTEEFLQISKREPWIIPQIEHVEAFRNLDEILEVEGIDSICIGPYDLSCSVNKPGMLDDPEVSGMLDEICRKARQKGIVVGGYGGDQYQKWKDRGANWIALSFDMAALASKFRDMLTNAQKVNKYVPCTAEECRKCFFKEQCSDTQCK